MNRSQVLRVAAILAVAAMMSLAGIPARGQDPFQPPPPGASANRSDGDKANGRVPSSGAARDRKKAREPERIVRTNEEWQKLLTHEEFLVTRMKATEPAFSGKYATGHFKGTFLCVCCGTPLFDSKHKFDSGTGWPSFWTPVNPRSLETAWDYSEPQEARMEVTCRRCGAHLGHVFQDGPPPTGLRFCINSLSLKLEGEKPKASTTGRKASSRVQSTRASRKAQSKSTRRAAPTVSKAEQVSPPGS